MSTIKKLKKDLSDELVSSCEAFKKYDSKKYMKNVMKMIEFLYDRHLIYHKKEILKEEYPWTDDPVLRDSFFCNISKDLDKGTRYLYEHKSISAMSNENKLFNIVFYRFFNLYGFYENILNSDIPRIETFDVKHYEEILDGVKAQGKTIFSSAYLIGPGAVNKEYRPKCRHVQVLYSLEEFKEMLENGYLNEFPDDFTGAIDYLKRIYKVGPFLAGQILYDYTKLVDPSFDRTWSIIGPGARVGIELIFGEKKRGFKTKECILFTEWVNRVQHKLIGILKEETGKDFYRISGSLENNEIPFVPGTGHPICEFRKYTKLNLMKSGGGRCKIRRYKA